MVQHFVLQGSGCVRSCKVSAESLLLSSSDCCFHFNSSLPDCGSNPQLPRCCCTRLGQLRGAMFEQNGLRNARTFACKDCLTEDRPVRTYSICFTLRFAVHSRMRPNRPAKRKQQAGHESISPYHECQSSSPAQPLSHLQRPFPVPTGFSIC